MGVQDRDALRSIAEAGARQLRGAPPQTVLNWALDTFHPRLAITSSMSDAVLVHMASKIRPGVPVIFIDTGYHFAETLGTRDAMAAAYAADVITVAPHRTVGEQDASFGSQLYERDPDACCHMRKLEPLEVVLQSYDAWASGIRRDEGGARSNIQPVEWDAKRSKVKVSPLAYWTAAEVNSYIGANNIVVNPLLNDGYRSVGCAPCTQRVAAGDDARAGRWPGHTKTECGLHL